MFFNGKLRLPGMAGMSSFCILNVVFAAYEYSHA